VSIFERILRQSSLYSVSLVVGKLSSVILLPLYTHYLSPASYGILDLLSSAQLFFELLVTIRLSDGMLYFYAKAPAGEPRKRHAVVSTALWSAFAFTVVTLLVAGLFANPIAYLIFHARGYETLVRIAFFGVACLPVSEIGLSWLRATDSPVAYAVISIARLLVNAGFCVIFLAVYGMGPAGVLWATALGAFFPSFALAIWLIWKNGLLLDWKLLWQQFQYAAPLCLSGLGLTFIHYGDRFFLERAVSLTELGLYSLAYKIGMLVSFVMTPFNLYWNAQMFHVVRGEEGDRIFTRLFTYLALVLSLTGMGVSLMAPLALHFLATPAFMDAALLVPVVALAYVIRGLGDQLRSIFSLYKRTGQTSIVTGFGVVVCMIFYSWWIPKWGVSGALAATVAAFATMFTAAFVLSRRVKRFDFEWRRLAILGGANVAVVTLDLFFAPTALWPRSAFGALLMMVWCGLLLAAGFFSPGEKEWLRYRVKVWA
jgi:O-antigen/teichoic acid export membrane protein